MGQTTRSGLNNHKRFVSALRGPLLARVGCLWADGLRADGKLAVAKTDWEVDEGPVGNGRHLQSNYSCSEVESTKL